MKHHFLSISLLVSVCLFAGIGYSIAFASADLVVFEKSLSNYVFSSSRHLNTTIVTYKSSRNISDFQLKSSCDIVSRGVRESSNRYSFHISYTDPSCWDDAIWLEDQDARIIPGTFVELEVLSDFELYNRLTDYSDQDLALLQQNLLKKMKPLEIFSQYQEAVASEKYDFYSKKILYHQLLYRSNIIANIQAYRASRYIVPVAGKAMPYNHSHLPNSTRPYRAAYTDGIHHGWDISGAFWEPVIALDRALVIRVVDGFDDDDFDRLQKTAPVSLEDQIKNLDILRGNQVWLKTMKWDIVFYSHLEDVDVEFWDILDVWDPVGTIGVTGVPSSDYIDYHLHFPIHKNPYHRDQAWGYSYDDVMTWDWYFKWESTDYIRKHQDEVFK